MTCALDPIMFLGQHTHNEQLKADDANASTILSDQIKKLEFNGVINLMCHPKWTTLIVLRVVQIKKSDLCTHAPYACCRQFWREMRDPN